MRVIKARIIIPERLRVNRRNEILTTAANKRNILLSLCTYSLSIKKKGREERRYSAAKLLCPKVEPGGITEGKGIKFNWKTSSTPIMLNKVETITTEYETTLRNLSSPRITSRRADCRRILNGTIISLNSSRSSEAELLIKAVKKLKGKTSIRIERNLFSGILVSILDFIKKTTNNSIEIEKKNIR